MKLDEALKQYASYLNENIFEKTVHSKTANAKIRKYFLEKFEGLGLNPEYFRMIKLSNKFVNFTDFLEKIPENERNLYIKNKDLIIEFLDAVQGAAEVRMEKIAQSKKLSAEIAKIDPMAKYVLNYFKNVKYAKLELKKHLSKKSIDEILEKYKFIEDFLK